MYNRKTIAQLTEEAEGTSNPVTRASLNVIICSRAVELELECNKNATITRRMDRLIAIRKVVVKKRFRLGLLLVSITLIVVGTVLVLNSITFIGG
jgi:hypothetical protein